MNDVPTQKSKKKQGTERNGNIGAHKNMSQNRELPFACGPVEEGGWGGESVRRDQENTTLCTDIKSKNITWTSQLQILSNRNT